MEIIFMFPGNSSPSKVSAMECDIDGSEQDCSMSSALVLEILQSCTKPSLCPCNYSWVKWHISWLIVSHWCQGRYNVNTNILKIFHHQKTCNFVPACSTDGNSHFVMATQAVQLPAFFSASCSQFRPGEKKYNSGVILSNNNRFSHMPLAVSCEPVGGPEQAAKCSIHFWT